MRYYIARRLLLVIPSVFVVSVIVFSILNVAPGDVATYIVAGEKGAVADPRDLARVRQELGLDRPLYVQYFSWVGHILRLDFGRSYTSGRPVIDEVRTRIPYSLVLVCLAAIFSALLAIPLGILSAVQQGKWLDYGARIFAIAGITTPSFLVGILVLLVLTVKFHWYPPLEYSPIYRDPWTGLQQLILPALVTGYRQTGVATRMMRSTMLEVLGEDFVRTAYAKGLRKRAVLLRHAARVALLPVMSLFGLEMIAVFGSLVIIELLFNIPGLGRLIVDALVSRDIPLAQGVIMLLFFFVVAVNLLIDIGHAWLDPRIRHS